MHRVQLQHWNGDSEWPLTTVKGRGLVSGYKMGSPYSVRQSEVEVHLLKLISVNFGTKPLCGPIVERGIKELWSSFRMMGGWKSLATGCVLGWGPATQLNGASYASDRTVPLLTHLVKDWYPEGLDRCESETSLDSN